MSKVLVSLVSHQTIPNIEFIREMKENVDQYLFISTIGMEKSGTRNWILDTIALDQAQLLETVIVNEFSFEDIETKLIEAINDEDTYIVNLTGGTKVMSLAVYEFFKSVSSEMYYLTGKGEKIKLHPGRRKVASKLNATISLRDYLTAYGFNITNQSSPLRNKETAQKCLGYFLHQFDKARDVPALQLIRSARGKGIKDLANNPELLSFIHAIDFETEAEGKLSKYECRYLSGDWLEEYLYYFLKDHFDITGSSIGLGLHVEKGGTPNEFDVLLMRNNKMYLFECKTSVYLNSEESQTFISETIYKSDSLRNKFGLFAQTTIVTLSDLTSPKLTKHVERAKANRVKLIDRYPFLEESLAESLTRI